MHQCLLSTHSVSHLVSIWQKEKFIHLKLRITNDSIDSFKQYIIDNYHKSHEIFYYSTFFHIQLIGGRLPYPKKCYYQFNLKCTNRGLSPLIRCSSTTEIQTSPTISTKRYSIFVRSLHINILYRVFPLKYYSSRLF